MSVWEMDCSGKGSVVFRLRNNFLHFWTLAFFFFSSFFKDKTVLGRDWVHLLYSIFECLSAFMFEVGSENYVFKPVMKWIQ